MTRDQTDPLDSTPRRDDPAWVNIVVGQAVAAREASTCAKAYVELKRSIEEFAKAQEALDALPEVMKPASEEERNRDILSSGMVDAAEHKIMDYARRDAVRMRVELAQMKMTRCRNEAERTYEVLVSTLVE